mmetsp:Transcript_22917/g.41280  ORF Transcript_22917/g.41280 Transcript_22917/m.41280 type:complete len:230 (+) Transcript_22917:346-1035(+)
MLLSLILGIFLFDKTHEKPTLSRRSYRPFGSFPFLFRSRCFCTHPPRDLLTSYRKGTLQCPCMALKWRRSSNLTSHRAFSDSMRVPSLTVGFGTMSPSRFCHMISREYSDLSSAGGREVGVVAVGGGGYVFKQMSTNWRRRSSCSSLIADPADDDDDDNEVPSLLLLPAFFTSSWVQNCTAREDRSKPCFCIFSRRDRSEFAPSSGASSKAHGDANRGGSDSNTLAYSS